MRRDISERYTIRKCISDLRRIGTNRIYLRNSTLILITELSLKDGDGGFSKFKGPDNVMRKIFCQIKPSNRTVGLDSIEKFCLYSPKDELNFGMSFFRADQYLIPEREMNAFIFANRGIDHLSTISTPECVLADIMEGF